MVSGVCAAQQSPQFKALPYVQSTGGRVTSILRGIFQYQTNAPGLDILYINAPAMASTPTGKNPTIVAGIMLNRPPSFQLVDLDKISFTNVSNVVAALGDFNGDQITDFAFALSPASKAGLDGNTLRLLRHRRKRKQQQLQQSGCQLLQRGSNPTPTHPRVA